MVENFLNYDKITDTIMFFNKYITLNFLTRLKYNIPTTLV